MRSLLIAVALLAAGCGGAAQNIARCTLEQRQGLAGPLADLIWEDVRSGHYEPSRVARETVAGFVVDYGVTAVKCALQELLREWGIMGIAREARHDVAEAITRSLLADL